MTNRTEESDTDAPLPGLTQAWAGTDAPMRIEIMTTWCSNSSCPTVYRTSRNTVVVQGYTVNAEEAGVSVPAGERLVEIPMELLRAAALDLE